MSSTRSSAKAAPCTVSAAKSLARRAYFQNFKKPKNKRCGAERSSIKPNNMVFIQHHHSMKDSLTLFDRIAGTPSPRSNRFVPALRDSSAPRSSRDGFAR